jgi:hypothetical protein
MIVKVCVVAILHYKIREEVPSPYTGKQHGMINKLILKLTIGQIERNATTAGRTLTHDHTIPTAVQYHFY